MRGGVSAQTSRTSKISNYLNIIDHHAVPLGVPSSSTCSPSSASRLVAASGLSIMQMKKKRKAPEYDGEDDAIARSLAAYGKAAVAICMLLLLPAF